VTTSGGQLNGTGIDVRGNGGYAIFPPSQRSDGKVYEVEDCFDYFNIAEAPDWLYGLIKPKPTISRQTIANIRRRPATVTSVCRGIEGIIRAIATAAPGERNKVLFWS
jgi:Bifunctional DNA primase/polymerase, N-terminal